MMSGKMERRRGDTRMGSMVALNSVVYSSLRILIYPLHRSIRVNSLLRSNDFVMRGLCLFPVVHYCSGRVSRGSKYWSSQFPRETALRVNVVGERWMDGSVIPTNINPAPRRQGRSAAILS